MKTQQHNMDSRQRYEVTAMVIPPQQHSPTNGQAALDYAGENFHRVADIMLNRPWSEAQQAVADIFAAGMRHVMSLPLADRLTDEEREGFRSCHRQLGHLKEEALNKAERALCQGQQNELGLIFGEEIFKPTATPTETQPRHGAQEKKKNEETEPIQQRMVELLR